MIVEKEMFLGVYGKQVGMEMIECQMAVEFLRSDAATGKERRPTVVSRNGGTSSCCDDEERSWRRPGRSETQTSWSR